MQVILPFAGPPLALEQFHKGSPQPFVNSLQLASLSSPRGPSPPLRRCGRLSLSPTLSPLRIYHLSPTMTVNGSFVSPTADAKVAQRVAQLDVNGVLSTVLNGVNGWTILLTTLLLLVAYDQCKLICTPLRPHTANPICSQIHLE